MVRCEGKTEKYYQKIGNTNEEYMEEKIEIENDKKIIIKQY